MLTVGGTMSGSSTTALTHAPASPSTSIRSVLLACGETISTFGGWFSFGAFTSWLPSSTRPFTFCGPPDSTTSSPGPTPTGQEKVRVSTVGVLPPACVAWASTTVHGTGDNSATEVRAAPGPFTSSSSVLTALSSTTCAASGVVGASDTS